MVNKKIIERLESPSFRIDHIFGCRMRRRKEVRYDVLGRRGGKYKKVPVKRQGSNAPLKLKVKEVKLNDDRYIICYNPEQARKDAEDRKA